MEIHIDYTVVVGTVHLCKQKLINNDEFVLINCIVNLLISHKRIQGKGDANALGKLPRRHPVK